MTSAFLSLLADHVVLVCVGLLAAAALAWPARALLKRDPQSCYQLLLALLVGAVAVLPIQLLVQGRAAPLAAPAREWFRSLQWRESVPPDARGRSTPEPSEEPFKTFLVDASATSPAAEGEPSPVAPEADPTGRIAALAPVARTALAPASPSFFERLSARVAAAVRPAARSITRAARRVGWERAVAGLWLAGVALIALRRGLRAVRTVRMLARSRPVEDPAVLALWRRVAGESRIGARVRLVASTAVESPACTGLLRRVLVLPARPARPLAPEVLEWALRHELVHLERGDQWAALFQSAVTALLWFHPAAWWLSAEIGRLRELSCDQRVVESSGRRRSYALALLECAASVSNPITAIDADPHSAGVRCALLHWSRSPTQIRRRIEMLTVESQSLPRTRKVLGILLAGCALAVPALAQVAGAATLLPARQQVPATPAPPALTLPAQDGGTATPAPAKKKKRRVSAPAGALAPAPVDATAATAPCEPCPPSPQCPPCDPCTTPAPVASLPAVSDLAALGYLVDSDGDGQVDLSIVGGDGDYLAISACDEETAKIAEEVRAQVRAAQRQAEQALKQAQRAQTSQTISAKRQLEQLRRQEERVRTQQQKKRTSLEKRIAESDEQERAELEKQAVELEAAAADETTECDRRCAELEAKLAELDQVDLSECFASLGDYQQTMDAETAELSAALQQLAAQAYAQQDGDADDGQKRAAKLRAADAEKIAKRARVAAERARKQVDESLARAGQGGAVNAATKAQIEQALARVGQVDAEEVQRAVERAVAASQRGASSRRRSSVQGAPADEVAAEDAAARAPRTARSGGAAVRARQAPRADARPEPSPRAGGQTEARLMEKIDALEAEIQSLRAELARLHEQPPAAPPAKRVRAMR